MLCHEVTDKILHMCLGQLKLKFMVGGITQTKTKHSGRKLTLELGALLDDLVNKRDLTDRCYHFYLKYILYKIS